MNGGEGGRKKKPNTDMHKYTTLSPQNTCRKKKLKKKKKTKDPTSKKSYSIRDHTEISK
jgi:hypothetical protein